MSNNLHCASCGRSEKSEEDGVKPVLYLGQKWCTYCAAIVKTNEGIYVSQPSPGLMVEGATNDALVAWEDCYSKSPKKRILKKNAKKEIQRAWAIWDGDKNSNMSMFIFYGWLTKFRPYFLTFRSRGDPWQEVHSWLLQYERLKKQNDSNDN